MRNKSDNIMVQTFRVIWEHTLGWDYQGQHLYFSVSSFPLNGYHFSSNSNMFTERYLNRQGILPISTWSS